MAFILGWRECCSCQASCCWRLQQSSSKHSPAVVLHAVTGGKWAQGCSSSAWGLHLVSRAALARGKGGPQLSRVSTNGTGASAHGQVLSYQNAALSSTFLEAASWRARPFITCSIYAPTKCREQRLKVSELLQVHTHTCLSSC